MAEIVQADVPRRPAQPIRHVVGIGIESIITMSLVYPVADILSPLTTASTFILSPMLTSAPADRSTKLNLTRDLVSLRYVPPGRTCEVDLHRIPLGSSLGKAQNRASTREGAHHVMYTLPRVPGHGG